MCYNQFLIKEKLFCSKGNRIEVFLMWTLLIRG